MGTKKGKVPLDWGNMFALLAVPLAVLIFTSVPNAWSDLLFWPGTITGSGQVTACQVVYYPKNGSYCEATVSFVTPAGKLVTAEMAAGDAKVGDTLSIRYHLNDPEGAHIDNNFFDLWFAGICLGLFLINVCCFLFWKRWREREDARIHKGLAKNTWWLQKRRRRPKKSARRHARG